MDRNNSLDSLRFLAALCVAVAHCLTAFSTQPFHAQTWAMMDFSNVEGVFARLIQLVFNAHSAVIIFFVLSGFVLTLSLQRLASVNYGVEFFVFVIRRIYRIFPALICSLLILGYMISYPSDKLVQNMLLMDTSINSVAWTLKVELVGCLVVFSAFMARRIWWPGLIIVGCALLVLFFGGFMSPIFAKYLPAFFVGSMIVYVSRGITVGRLAAYSALVLMLVSDMVFGYKTDASILIQTACAGILILSIGRSESMTWLNRPVLSFLGKISFSFYLMHLAGMILTRQLCVKLGIPLGKMSMIENAAIYAAISVPLTVAISVITYQLVELPMNKVGGATATSFRKVFCQSSWSRATKTVERQSTL